MEAKIKTIEKSTVKAGYVFVSIVGKDYKIRKVYTYKSRPGFGFINLDTDIYSFKWDGEHGTEITYMGSYKTVDDAVKEVDDVVVEIEPVVEPVIEVEPVTASGEVNHKMFKTIKTCVEANIPVYLVGPAGSGKNHTLEQIAWDLGLKFYFTNSIQQEYKVTGFIDANGTFHETEFYKAFVNGGLFFLDEMDASIPEVLVLLNAAIANRYFEFPNGRVDAHESFRIVAAGNTMGSGSDEKYTGRLVLDQATLDRFAILEFGYDDKIELHLAKGNYQLVDFIHSLRKQADQKGIRATFSYRCISMVMKLEGKIALPQVILMAVVKGMDKDTINTFRSEGTSKYFLALKEAQAQA